MVKNVEAWEQQPHESSKAYERFKIYLSLPRNERNYAKVHENLTKIVQKTQENSGNREKNNKIPSVNAIEQMASKRNWVERVRLYDMNQDFEEQLAQAEEFEEENTKWKKLWQKMLDFANKLLVQVMENNDEYKLTTQMSLFNSLVSLLDNIFSISVVSIFTEQTGTLENEITINDEENAENIQTINDKELEELLTINDEEEQFTDKL